MSNRTLATKRRKWERTKKTKDEANYLLERVKEGDLEREKLELSAHLGHPASCLALETAAFVADTPIKYIHSLKPWGKPIFIVAAIAASRLTLPFWEKAFPEIDKPRLAIDYAISWCKNPCDELELLAREAAHKLMGNSILGYNPARIKENQLRSCLDSAAYTASAVVMTTAISMCNVADAITFAREVLTREEPNTFLSVAIQEALIPLALTGNSPALESLVKDTPEAQ